MVELSYLFGQFCIFADIYYNIMKIIFINTLRILMILVIMISCGVAYVVYEDTLAALVDTCWSGTYNSDSNNSFL